MKGSDRIGIVAPYHWDEATYMAGGLLNLAVNQFNIDASFLTGPHRVPDGIHYTWDATVEDGDKANFDAWCKRCSQIVWFHIAPPKLQKAIDAGCKNTLVCLPDRMTKADLALFPKFDRVITTTQPLYQLLKAKRLGPKILYLPWDSNFPITAKEARRPGPVRLVVPVDSSTGKHNAPLLCFALRAVLDGDPNLQVQLLYGAGWGRAGLVALHELQDRHPKRFMTVKKPNHCQRVEAYKEADWVFCCATESIAGLHALEALAFGCPVIAYDCMPYTEILKPFHNACLAKCDTKDRSGSLLSTPEINAWELIETLRSATSDRNVLHMLRSRHWPELEERRRNFQLAWKKLWALEQEEESHGID